MAISKTEKAVNYTLLGASAATLVAAAMTKNKLWLLVPSMALSTGGYLGFRQYRRAFTAIQVKADRWTAVYEELAALANPLLAEENQYDAREPESFRHAVWNTSVERAEQELTGDIQQTQSRIVELVYQAFLSPAFPAEGVGAELAQARQRCRKALDDAQPDIEARHLRSSPGKAFDSRYWPDWAAQMRALGELKGVFRSIARRECGVPDGPLLYGPMLILLGASQQEAAQKDVDHFVTRLESLRQRRVLDPDVVQEAIEECTAFRARIARLTGAKREGSRLGEEPFIRPL